MTSGKKKVTVKDIAKEAGVSIATVSYIMNNRTDVKISEKTRKKVLQIANLLNYTPSTAAQSLATGKNNRIGIAYVQDVKKPSRNLQVFAFVDKLMRRLERMHYDIQFIPTDSLPVSSFALTHVDGIIAIDLPGEVFAHLADSYLVPIISVDMIIDDPLFYQVYSDYPDAIRKALLKDPETILVMEPFGNEAYTEFVRKALPAKYCAVDGADEKTLSGLKGHKLIVLGTYLALLLRPYVADSDLTVIDSDDSLSLLDDRCPKISIDTSVKANLTINLLLNAIDHNFVVEHKHCLPLNVK